jgi:hypothetical protein
VANIARLPEDDQVGPLHLFDLGHDVGGQGFAVPGLALLQRVGQVLRVLALAKVGRAGHRVEAHGVQIRHLHLPAQLLEVLDGGVLHRGDKGLGLVVGVDNQQLHGGILA